MCKMVTNTIIFCHTEALGMQIQRGTINNHNIKKKKKGGEGEQTPSSHFSANVLLDSRLTETFLLPAWAAEPRPHTGRRGMLAEGVARKWVWLAAASQSSSAVKDTALLPPTLCLHYFPPTRVFAAFVRAVSK